MNALNAARAYTENRIAEFKHVWIPPHFEPLVQKIYADVAEKSFSSVFVNNSKLGVNLNDAEITGLIILLQNLGYEVSGGMLTSAKADRHFTVTVDKHLREFIAMFPELANKG